jgi:uncharacterized protein
LIELISISLLVFFASAVGTFSGFGTSTIMVPVMLLFFPLPVTLLFVGIIHWFGDIWKMILFRTAIRKWPLILWFAIPGIGASYIGAAMSLSVAEEILTRILGGFLLAYVLFILFKREWKLPEHNLTAGAGGLASGFAAGIFGVGGAIRGAFLSAFNLPKGVYIFTSGAMALVIDSTRIAGYLAGGARLEGLFLWGLLLFVPVSLLGAWTASRFVNRVPQKRFRLFIAVFLAAVALRFLLLP